MSNTSKTMKWSNKVKTEHLTIGTLVQLRNGVFTTIVRMDGVSPVTRVSPKGTVKFHRPDGTHLFGEPHYDIVRVLKAVKDKSQDLRKATVGSRITFSNGQKAVVLNVELDGSESTFIGHDNHQVKEGWYFNFGKYVSDESAPRIIKLKPPKKDSE